MSPSADSVHSTLTPRAALGGPWGFNAARWAGALVPSSALAVLFEAGAPLPSALLIAMSVVLQQATAAAVTLPVAALLRRTGRTLPIWLAFVVWAAAGATRGIVGGLVALSVGAPPQFGFRVLLWVQVGCIWMPLTAYVLAQVAHRRTLLAELSAVEEARDRAAERATQNGRAIGGRVVAALDATVAPAVRDVRSRLSALTAEPAHLAEIGERLAALSETVSRAVHALSASPGDTFRAPRVRPAPVAAALAFERRRPLLWAGAAGTLFLLLASTLSLAAGEARLVPGLAAATVTGAAALALVSASSRRTAGVRPWAVARRHLVAACTSSLVVLLFHHGSGTPVSVVVPVLLPLSLAYAAVHLSFAVGCSAANAELVAQLARVERERRQLEQQAADTAQRVREQLSALTHGPIQGRLAACAMALSFHAEEQDGERTAYIAAAVLDHLDAVSADLAGLVSGSGVPNTRLKPA